ncbi:MAG: hypothetical protein IT306_12420 [Chloroflexi bacterium]|nr:hypothetical protein [Chloroflexota bacterium]
MRRALSALLLVLLLSSVCLPPAQARADRRREYLERTQIAYDAMDAAFFDGRLYVEYDTSLGTDDYADLWNYSRAMSAVMDVYALGLIDIEEVRSRIGVIHAYHRRDRPIFQALVMPPDGRMDDIYYDDNAWVGLNLLRYYQLTGDEWALAASIDIFNTDIQQRGDAYGCQTGGLYWKEQKDGETNHDRATITTSAIALLGVRLYAQTGDPHFWEWSKGARTWLELYMTDPESTLHWDRIEHDCTVDKTIWSYSQGMMIGTYATVYSLTTDPAFLARAEQMAEKMLREDWYSDQSFEGNAIYFKNLLVLKSVSDNQPLKRKIDGVIRRYARDLWENQNRHRVPGLFYVDEEHEYALLLHEASIVEIFALVALDESWYFDL